MYILHLICINSKLNLTKAFLLCYDVTQKLCEYPYLVASEGYFY